MSGPVELSTTGNSRLDKAIESAILDCYDRFELNPAFFYVINDPTYDHNAFARRKYSGSYSELPGVVGFGLPFLFDKMAIDSTGFTVMYIIAHEFGHILQYNYRTSFGSLLVEALTLAGGRIKLVELHADFISGSYLADRFLRDQTQDLSILNRTIVGDEMFSDPMHHGTTPERHAAFLAGYESRMAYGRINHSVIDAIAIEGVDVIKAKFNV